MKKIYMTPETIGVAIKTESFLLTLSSGSVKPEAPDSGLDGGGTIEVAVMATASHQPNYTVLIFGKLGKNTKFIYVLKRGKYSGELLPLFFDLSSCIFGLFCFFRNNNLARIVFFPIFAEDKLHSAI